MAAEVEQTVYATGGVDEVSFQEQVTMETAGTANQSILLKAWPSKNPPVIDATGFPYGISIEADYVIVDGFTVENAASANIWVSGADNVTILKTEIADGVTTGILLQSTTNSTVEKCAVHNQNGTGIQVSSASTNNVIKNNLIYNNGFTAGSAAGGIYMAQSSNNLQVLNNTFYGHIREDGDGFGVKVDESENVTIKNNILANNSIGVDLDETSRVSVISNYNNLYPGTEDRLAVRVDAEEYADLSAWQSGSTIDANSIANDPLFLSTATGSEDFHLGVNSPSIDAGTTIAEVEKDYNDDTERYFGQAYDQGAYEIDNQSPVISDLYPEEGESVAKSTVINFTLTDTDSGLDLDNISLLVNGQAATLNSNVITPLYSYEFYFDPTSDFVSGSTTTVEISAQDLAYQPNEVTLTYSFNIASSPGAGSTPTYGGGGGSISAYEMRKIVQEREREREATKTPEEKEETVRKELQTGIALYGNYNLADCRPSGRIFTHHESSFLKRCELKPEFNDIMGHWSYGYVQYLSELVLPASGTTGTRVMDDFVGTSFRPNDLVNRAQITKMALLINGIKIPAEVPAAEIVYSDVPKDNSEMSRIIYAATAVGIIEGYPDGNFRPYQRVNRAEALKILLKSAQIRHVESAWQIPNPFTDVSSGAWYSKYILFSYKNNLVNGYHDESFQPARKVSRSELVKMLVKVMDYQNK